MRKEENNYQTDNKSRVDPNLPKWVCQKCHHSLTIVGVDSYAGKFFNDSPPSGLPPSSLSLSLSLSRVFNITFYFSMESFSDL